MSAPTVNHNIINDAIIKGFNSDYGQMLLITECQANGVIYKNKQYVDSDRLLKSLEEDTLILINKALFDKI